MVSPQYSRPAACRGKRQRCERDDEPRRHGGQVEIPPLNFHAEGAELPCYASLGERRRVPQTTPDLPQLFIGGLFGLLQHRLTDRDGDDFLSRAADQTGVHQRRVGQRARQGE